MAELSAEPKRSVAVRILGYDYRIRTDADPDTVERVAELLNETMKRIRVRTGTVDTLDLAVLAGLSLANDVVARRNPSFVETSREGAARLRRLVDEVEALLEA